MVEYEVENNMVSSDLEILSFLMCVYKLVVTKLLEAHCAGPPLKRQIDMIQCNLV